MNLQKRKAELAKEFEEKALKKQEYLNLVNQLDIDMIALQGAYKEIERQELEAKKK